jgi:G3E family GTPase
MLSNIIRNMQQIEYERISVLAPITIVDGQSFPQSFGEFKELYLDQVSSARTVFVSKLENGYAAERSTLEKELRKINPTAEIITEHYSTMPKDKWNSLLERLYDGTVIESPRPEAEVLPDSFSLKGASMDCPERLIMLLEGLIHGRYGNVFRAKGKLRAGDNILRFEAVDGRYSIEEDETVDEGKAVFIGTDIKRQSLRENFFVASQKIQIKKRKPDFSWGAK